MANKPICSIGGCNKPIHNIMRSLCSGHYQRLRKHGSPTGGGTSKGALLEWLHQHAFTHPSDSCLLWPFGKTQGGYGQLSVHGQNTEAHVYVCERTHGPRPNRHQAAHSCGNGGLGCVNSRHLRWATPRENSLDRRAHGTDIGGMRNSQCKLSDASVAEIRSLGRAMPQATIAAQYGVSRRLIGMIISGKIRAYPTGHHDQPRE